MYENTVLAGFFGRSVPALDKSKDQMYYDDIKMISNQSALSDEDQDGDSQKKEGIVWEIKVNFRKRKN